MYPNELYHAQGSAESLLYRQLHSYTYTDNSIVYTASINPSLHTPLFQHISSPRPLHRPGAHQDLELDHPPSPLSLTHHTTKASGCVVMALQLACARDVEVAGTHREVRRADRQAWRWRRRRAVQACRAAPRSQSTASMVDAWMRSGGKLRDNKSSASVSSRHRART